MTKIDLDELEHKANGVHRESQDAEWFKAMAEFREVTPPTVVISLIARIRELESGLSELAYNVERTVQCESQCDDFHDDLDWKPAERARELLAKGVTT